MKHIVIAGCSRTGKTMIANSFSKMGYIPYRMDSIKRAIYESFSLEKAESIGFVSLRFRHNVYSNGDAFLSYRMKLLQIISFLLYKKKILQILIGVS